MVKGRASRYHGAKFKTQGVLEGGENLTGTRHPSRQATEEERAEGTVSLDKQSGPKFVEAKMGQKEPVGPWEKCQQAGWLPSVPLVHHLAQEGRSYEEPCVLEGHDGRKYNPLRSSAVKGKVIQGTGFGG